MYSILVVDDEFFIRDGLMSFNWEALGFKAIGQASDGNEALNLIGELSPDVVLADIRMPVLDGLELSRNIKETYPKCKVVLLSGYNDFEYARTAIRYDVFDFLVKPIDFDSLIKTFSSLKNSLDKERRENSELRRIRQQNMISNQLAVEHFLAELVTQKIVYYSSIEEKLNLFEIDLSGNNFTCLQFLIDLNNASYRKITGEDLPIIKFAFNNIITELLQTENCGTGFTDDNLNIVLLLNFKGVSNMEVIKRNILNFASKVKMHCENYIGILYQCSLSCGIGNTYSNLLNVPISYSEAGTALKAVFTKGSGKIYHISKLEFLDGNVIGSYPYEKEKQLLSCIMNGSIEEYEQLLHNYISELKLIASKFDPTAVKEMVAQFYNLLYRNFCELDLDLCNILSLRTPVSVNILNLGTLESLIKFVEDSLYKSVNHISGVRSSINASSKLAVVKAKEFISKNYNKKLTLIKVASSVYLAPNYLSMLFKKETGENFIDYLKRYRIEKAKELLKRPDLKVYEISEMIGYENPKYFTDMFKDYTGMSPIEYKNSL